MSRVESGDMLGIVFIVGLIVLSVVTTIAITVGETVQRTSCFDNGGSWQNNTCTIDKNHEQ